MITEDYCSDEVAKLLREKGFNEPVTELNKLLFKEGKKPVLKITIQKAMKWLREVHNLYCDIPININGGGCYGYWIVLVDRGEIMRTSMGIEYNTYEKACEAAIKYCLEHLI